MEETKIIELYADGGCVKKNPSPFAITWAWCAVDENDRRVIERGGIVLSQPGRPASNNWAEQIAIVLALEAMPDGWSGLVCSDSMIALGRVFKGWRTKNLPENIKQRAKDAVARLGKIETRLLQGHPTKKDLENGVGAKRGFPVSKHNVFCDEECNRQAKKFEAERGKL